MRTTKQIILSLIRDDIRNTKLIDGLNVIGLHAQNYYLHLPETIFTLMEIPPEKDSDELFEWYTAKIKSCKTDEIWTSKLEELSEEIYTYLQKSA